MPRLRPGGQSLEGKQIKLFREALLDAFDLDRFDEMLRFQINQVRQRIALGNDFETIVLRVIERAEMENWTAELLQAARAVRPENVKLFTLAQQFALSPKTETLERTIRKSNPLFDPALFRKNLAKLEATICRIEIQVGNSFEYGTGFLLGADSVMTNYHVVEKVIEHQVAPDKVMLRFDFKKLEDGTTVNNGKVYHLLPDPEWLIHSSKYNEFEKTDPDLANPSEDELDYALLRVEGSPGDDPIGGETVAGSQAQARGWIPLPVAPYPFPIESPLFILQHPEGDPLKIAFEMQSIIGLNANGTRVRHRTNTEGGSSGSPCFDADWNLVALHHLGDPNYAPTHKPEYNQGIPFSAILALLDKQGKRQLLN